ncbi:MAG: hypothetical protein IT437_00930 [Phycisphaerales bacterium]|nr:hypothetical protein [Phycisphaerales bacterium]
MRHALLVVATLLACSVHAQPLAPAGTGERYDGHRVVRATVRSQRDLDTLLRLSPDMWSHRVEAGGTDFRVPPGSMAALRASGIPFAVVVPDVQRAIDAERARLAPQAGGPIDGSFFDDFKTYAQVNAYLLTLRDLRPDLAEVFTIGASLEGREMRAIRIRNPQAGGGACKPMVLLTGTQHAREWIATMVTTYLADRFIRQYDTDPAIKAVVDAADIVIVPIVNPDGYEWTWTNTRLWRKNRRPNAGGSFGVDLNRNWGFKWGLPLPGGNGGNANPGSDVYWGTGPFSEPETAAIRDFALGKPQVRWHNDIHSYGQYLLYPWGWSPDPSPDDADFASLGAQFRALILAVHNLAYAPGRTYTRLYPVSGGITDWFYADRKAFAFLFELRGSPGGFVLPPDQIIPNCEEVFPAILAAAQWTIQRYPFRADTDHDCVYTLADFGAFQTLFAGGDPRADFNGDGVLNLADFGAFQTAWALGR